MKTVVNALVAVALFSGVAGIVTHILFGRALQRHGLRVPVVNDWSWARAKFPPDVSRIRTWIWIWAVLFLGSIAAATLITHVFDLCPDCVITGRGT
jgi:hypothetical protein